MNKAILFLLLFLSISCYSKRNTYIPSEKAILSNQILDQVARQLEEEVHLYKFGDMGAMFHQIKELGLSFQYYEPINIEEGRKLLIYAVNTLMAAVNANEKIRPYLNNYPFNPQNIEITIILRNPDQSTLPLDTLSILSCKQGIVKYRSLEPDNLPLKTIHQETYEEAVQIIQSEVERKG